MTKKLGEIADISTGLAHRRYESQEGKEYKILTQRAINNMNINQKELDTFKSKEEINTKYLTKKDDIILGLFTPYTATIITEETENMVVPQVFAIIRTKDINPEYLAYYLNSNKTRYEIQKRSSGTTIEKISIKNLKEIPIKTINTEEEKEFLKLINILNKRISIITRELELLKEIQTYYLNEIGE